VFDDRNVQVMRDVIFVAPSGVIGMSVRDDRIVDRPPGIEINIGLLAINPVVIKSEKWYLIV
jgi:hypothetical protein